MSYPVAGVDRNFKIQGISEDFHAEFGAVVDDTTMQKIVLTKDQLIACDHAAKTDNVVKQLVSWESRNIIDEHGKEAILVRYKQEIFDRSSEDRPLLISSRGVQKWYWKTVEGESKKETPIFIKLVGSEISTTKPLEADAIQDIPKHSSLRSFWFSHIQYARLLNDMENQK